MNVDALTSWLEAHPFAVDDAPDLVALAQTLARQLEESEEARDVASIAREYRMVLKELHGLDGDDGEENLAASMRATIRNPKDTR